ncbi:LysM domain-containing protein [Leifsonia sp. NPDC102414]|uniref:LysM domain-containing protein n=1 Tax=Leifsonia sp. NPDC102414 TaxID=3364124 RepID=UPI00382EA8C9
MFRRGKTGRADAAGTSRFARRVLAVSGAALVVPALLTGCALFGGSPAAMPSHTKHATPKATRTPTSTTATGAIGTATPSAAPVPPATLTPVPQGTVVAEGDVASPKGSIHFHYRMVSNGNNTYTAEYSGFTSTVPVPVSVTLLEIPPSVGDGLTFHGVGDHPLGGPTNAATASTALLGDVGQPSYLGTLVTYSSAPSADGVPVELGPDKVLAVESIHWSVPVRPSNVHPVDGGARPGANGSVTATTASGAPKRYAIAQGDNPTDVAARFGIPTEYLLWLNPDLPGDGGNQFLYASTSLNLDPDSL